MGHKAWLIHCCIVVKGDFQGHYLLAEVPASPHTPGWPQLPSVKAGLDWGSQQRSRYHFCAALSCHTSVSLSSLGAWSWVVSSSLAVLPALSGPLGWEKDWHLHCFLQLHQQDLLSPTCLSVINLSTFLYASVCVAGTSHVPLSRELSAKQQRT